MTTAASNDTAGITGQVLMYASPEPLDALRHARLGMRNSDRPFGFAASQHFIPLQIGEFGLSAVHYPIIFAGDTKTPLAVFGLREGENQFIDATGVYRPGVYIPSFIRRYPFVAAHDPQNDRMVVCIDRASGLWTEDKPDVMLFEAGQPSAFTKGCIEFCGQFDADTRRTESFVKLMNDLDLFESRQTTFTPRQADGANGEPVVMAEFFAISEAKLNALPADKLIELRDNGALAQIYAHLVSLLGWDRVVAESLIRQNAQATAGNA
jgi:hypothetical protein